ncbi:MAG: hypothetical protein ACP6IS_08665 [Candidatus Asgardarchaeia archaeon]
MNETNKKLEYTSRDKLNMALKSIRAEFSSYQTRATPLLLSLSILIGIILVRIFPYLSIPLLLTSIVILIFWVIKFLVYESAIKTMLLSSSYLLQMDTQMAFGKKLTAMQMLNANENLASSTMILNRKRVILIFLLLLLTYLINYVSLLIS